MPKPMPIGRSVEAIFRGDGEMGRAVQLALVGTGDKDSGRLGHFFLLAIESCGCDASGVVVRVA